MKLHVCLVRTESSGNIGSTIRAMANMGVDRLILIDPKCRVNLKARQMAAQAQDRLKDIVRYKSWDDFYKKEGEGIRIAFTRRAGRRRRVQPLKSVLAKIRRPKVENLYLVFGPEKNGLDVSDLAFMNYSCFLPVHGNLGSLNLSHAVLLGLFLVRERFPVTQWPKQIKGREISAVKPLYFPDQSIRRWLTAMGFDINARKSSAYLTLRKLFLQNCPSKHELHVLESVLQQNIRKLNQSALLTPENLADHIGDVTVKNVDFF